MKGLTAKVNQVKENKTTSGGFSMKEIEINGFFPVLSPAIPCILRHMIIYKNEYSSNFNNVKIEVRVSLQLPLQEDRYIYMAKITAGSFVSVEQIEAAIEEKQNMIDAAGYAIESFEDWKKFYVIDQSLSLLQLKKDYNDYLQSQIAEYMPELLPEKQAVSSPLDLQLFASSHAPSHILYTIESEEYIIRSFFDRPGHNCKNGYPSYVRSGGKNQSFSYIAGPFWSKQSARDILDLADYLLFLLNHWEEDLLRVSFNCNEKGNCNSYEVTCGKEHDASCKGGKMEKIWKSCIRHDSMMKKLKDVLEAKGIALYKDWSEFGTAAQKMVWWIER